MLTHKDRLILVAWTNYLHTHVRPTLTVGLILALAPLILCTILALYLLAILLYLPARLLWPLAVRRIHFFVDEHDWDHWWPPIVPQRPRRHRDTTDESSVGGNPCVESGPQGVRGLDELPHTTTQQPTPDRQQPTPDPDEIRPDVQPLQIDTQTGYLPWTILWVRTDEMCPDAHHTPAKECAQTQPPDRHGERDKLRTLLLTDPQGKGRKGYEKIRRVVKQQLRLDRLPKGSKECLVEMLVDHTYPPTVKCG